MSATAEIDAIAALCRDFSLELLPLAAAEDEAAARALDRGTEVFIAAIPGGAPADVVTAARSLARIGLRPVPHLAARAWADASGLRAHVARLVGDAGVTRVLVVGGDLAAPQGGFDSALALLRSDVLDGSGIRCVAFAGHPEGHPRIAAPALAQALRDKIALAEQRGLVVSIVTQFCFESAPILDWIRTLRAEGIAVPVHVGLVGRASARVLIKFARRCGIGASVRALGTHGAALLQLVRESGSEAVIRELALARRNSDAISGLHFFSFGGFARTARAAQAMAARLFVLRSDGSGFELSA
jgi:methylenetetrahydrofolate reductase (NADPH)